MPRKKKAKKTIGRVEAISFPDFHLHNVLAKIDTGAYTSTIHCYRIKERKQNGLRYLHIKFLDHRHPDYNKQGQNIYNYTRARVRSSSGHLEYRYKIKLKVKLGPHQYKTEFTLTNRSEMRYPVLLGRRLLVGRFMVDVDKRFLLSGEAGSPNATN